MIKQTYFPSSYNELLKFINNYCEINSRIAVQAGHFLLYQDHTENLLLPCVKEELLGPRFQHIKDAIGYFPHLSLEIGLNILNELPCKEKSILTVVNDWQYLDKNIDRAVFYKNNKEYFNSYKNEYMKYKNINVFSPSRIGLKTKTGEWFSEITLRNQFNRVIAKKIKNNDITESYVVDKDSENITCSLVDALGRKQQIYCAGKRGNCAHELAELNRQVLDLGNHDVFVNIYPYVCKNYVQKGTDWAYEIFLKDKITINIGMPTISVFTIDNLFENFRCEVTVHGN